jgi:hypothetical protein
MKKDIQNAIAEGIVSLLAIGCGVLVGIATYGSIVLGLDGAHWVAAPASITYTYSPRVYGSYKGTRSGVEYVPHPVYTFVAIDGKTYTGTLNSIWYSTKSASTITDDMLEHPPVEKRIIYYNPKNPNQSAVEQPTFEPALTLVFGGLSIFFILLGIFALKEMLESLQHEAGRASDGVRAAL